MVVSEKMRVFEFAIEVYVRLMGAIGGSEISLLSGCRIECGGVSSKSLEAVRRVGMSVAGSTVSVNVSIWTY
jgi:hypothetical protein